MKNIYKSTIVNFCRIKSVVFLSFCFFSGCVESKCDLINELSKIEDENLAEFVCNYYQAEKGKKWQKTYEMRPEAYKKFIQFESYNKKMNEGMKGWNLIDIDVISYKRNDTKVEIEMEFHEKIDDVVKNDENIGFLIEDYLSDGKGFGNFKFDPRTNIVSIHDYTIWKYEKGSWNALSVGLRERLSMNLQIIFKD